MTASVAIHATGNSSENAPRHSSILAEVGEGAGDGVEGSFLVFVAAVMGGFAGSGTANGLVGDWVGNLPHMAI